MRKRANLAVLVGVVLVLIAAAEANLRAYVYMVESGNLDMLHAYNDLARPEQGLRTPLGAMIRLSRSDRMIYELYANLDVEYAGALVRTNAEGVRDRNYKLPKPPRSVRILGIGDSLMFGQGVPEHETYLDLLERGLNRRRPEVSIEVINAAVPGYNAAMEVAALSDRWLRYSPDMVIIGFCENDIWLPNFISARQDYFALDRSYLQDFLQGRMRGIKYMISVRLEHAPRLDVIEARDISPGDMARVPDPYRDMVGWAAYERSMRRLRALGAEHGFGVAVVYMGVEPTPLKLGSMALARSLGFRVIDAGAAIRGYMAANGIERHEGSSLVIPGDGHPSALAHGLAAHAIIEALSARGPVPTPTLASRTD